MDYNYTRSGNAISKSARVLGSQFVVNRGTSVVGPGTEVCGDRNNGRPVISWGPYVVLDGCALRPAERAAGEFAPLRIGTHVYIGRGSVVEASSIGNHVIIGANCRIGAHAVIRNCTIVPDNSEVPPRAAVGPMTKFAPAQRPTDLPESAESAIGFYCEMKYRGVNVEPPFNRLQCVP